jgi:hypothetical protein
VLPWYRDTIESYARQGLAGFLVWFKVGENGEYLSRGLYFAADEEELKNVVEVAHWSEVEWEYVTPIVSRTQKLASLNEVLYTMKHNPNYVLYYCHRRDA